MNAIFGQLSRLRDRDLQRLSDAVHAEIERRFTPPDDEGALDADAERGTFDISVLRARLDELRRSNGPRRAA